MTILSYPLTPCFHIAWNKDDWISWLTLTAKSSCNTLLLADSGVRGGNLALTIHPPVVKTMYVEPAFLCESISHSSTNLTLFS